MTIHIEKTQPPIEQLPDNYLISLENYSAISLSGEEQSKYLQGQVTCDVNAVEQEKLLFGSHCNAKGKVFSCFRLFNRNDEHLLFQPKATIPASIAELKKFGVFAKVDITTTDELCFYALVGTQAEQLLQEHFDQVPNSLSPVLQVGTTTLVYLTGSINRYLIIDNKSNITSAITALNISIFDSAIWNLLEITEGIPNLTLATDNEYVPQMLNMQAIHGISFTKGCYLGQETVARMQYLGKNKKALFSLSGTLTEALSADFVPSIIEKKLGENWRKAGDVTSYYYADDHTITLQAVLNNDVDSSTALRIKSLESATLSINALPYTLSQE